MWARNSATLLSEILRLDQIGHSNEIRQSSRAHFTHGATSMNFSRDFAYPKISGHLLIHLAGRHKKHHLLFTRREGLESLDDRRNIELNRSSSSIAFDRGHHGIEHFLVVKRLCKKVYCAALHCLYRHGYVAMPGHHDNGKSNANVDQLSLKIQPVHVRQTNVDYDASWPVREASRQKIACRSVRPCVKANRVKKTFQSRAQRQVIIDHVHERILLCRTRHHGRTNETIQGLMTYQSGGGACQSDGSSA